MTLTVTWLLPIVIIPGMWQVYEIPTTPQITEVQIPPQPEPNGSDNVVSSETRKEGEGVVLDEGAPEAKASTSQEPDQGEAYGTPSSSTPPVTGILDPKLMNLRRSDLPRRHQLWSILCRSLPVDLTLHIDDEVNDRIFILYLVQP